MHARASALLTGEPGVGKTCVLRALRHALAPANFRLVYCQNTTVGRRDFYRHLCLALGLAKATTAGDLFLAVSAHVEELARSAYALSSSSTRPTCSIRTRSTTCISSSTTNGTPSPSSPSLSSSDCPTSKTGCGSDAIRSLYSHIHHRFALGSLLLTERLPYHRPTFALASRASGATQGHLRRRRPRHPPRGRRGPPLETPIASHATAALRVSARRKRRSSSSATFCTRHSPDRIGGERA